MPQRALVLNFNFVQCGTSPSCQNVIHNIFYPPTTKGFNLIVGNSLPLLNLSFYISLNITHTISPKATAKANMISNIVCSSFIDSFIKRTNDKIHSTCYWMAIFCFDWKNLFCNKLFQNKTSIHRIIKPFVNYGSCSKQGISVSCRSILSPILLQANSNYTFCFAIKF